MKKILLSAYAISPYKGSEYGAAWNTILNLSKNYKLWVLYGISDEHMGDTYSLKNYLKDNTIPNIEFIEIKATTSALLINKFNKIGLSWLFYLAYYLWQKTAYKVAKRIVFENDIEIIHQLGPIGFREPGFLWKLNKPFVWGPIGGTVKIDNQLLKGKSIKSNLLFRSKNIINWYQLTYSSRVRQAINRANVLIAATSDDQRNINKYYSAFSYLLSEQGPMPVDELSNDRFSTLDDCFEIVWCGTLIERKNLQLLLRALSFVERKKWKLHVVGEGPLASSLKELAVSLKINAQIEWYGFVERKEALRIMANAHLHVICSITEGNPSVMFEALSYGVPTLTLNHSGMRDVLCEDCSIKIPVDKQHIMLETIVSKISYLLDNPTVLHQLSRSTIACSKKHSWSNRLSFLDQLYTEAEINWSTSESSKKSI
ncbi:glycosyltransferase family 4 protein [Spirosoma lituiforme]